MFEFASPHILLLLLLLPLLYIYTVYFRRRPSVVVTSIQPFSEVVHRRRMSFPQWCFLIGMMLLIIAIARPRMGSEKVTVRARGIDIILAIDLSGSMRAFDVPGNIRTAGQLNDALKKGDLKNRLETAKAEVRRFIEARPNDRIGLIGFADLAYNLAPPTLDHAWLLRHLERIEPGMLGDATGIASPIASGINRLKDSSAPRRVLVLFTDGRNTAENRLTPEQAAMLGKEFNVIIHTVGIGGKNAFVLAENPFGGSRPYPVQDEFDEPLLRKIAESSGGTYFHAQDGDGLKQVMDEINALEKTNIEQPKYIEYNEFAPNIALLALIAVLLGFSASTTWKLRLP